ncbi:MAG TPA: hypothetical protein VK736_11725 [Candidatus Binatia bacterium]|nr:hypothetical protein [Candidatus Binatia bacterium]
MVKPKVSAEEAVDLAFDVFVHYLPEEPPKVQLLRIQFSQAGSDFDYEPVWTGWVIFSTDIRWGGGYGAYGVDPAAQPTMAATFTWLYVSVDGKVLHETQNGFGPLEMVPSLPPD